MYNLELVFADGTVDTRELFDFLLATDPSEARITVTFNAKHLIPVDMMLKIRNHPIEELNVYLTEIDEETNEELEPVKIYTSTELTRLVQIHSFYDLLKRIFCTNLIFTIPPDEGV